MRFTQLPQSYEVTTSLPSVTAQHRLPQPKSLPWGSPFALDDPVTPSPIPTLSKGGYPGANRSLLIRSSILASISQLINTSASWNTSLLAWRTSRPPVLISLV
jgi:hypothetical protein